MRRLLIALGALILVPVGLFQLAMNTTTGQNFLMDRAVRVLAAAPEPPPDGLRVFVCGSASPLPAPGRAQACLAILTSEHFFVIDAGSGSANRLGLEQLPLEQLDGVLLTHFHSDHITDLPSINVQAWAGGHEGPLKIYGPPGVEQVIDGYNAALSQERVYRWSHHGRDFMPPEYGLLEPVEHAVEATLRFGELSITSFAADHSPVEPAVSYRVDYKGRSVVVTGDTIVTERLKRMTNNADLLLSDALSVPIVETLRRAMLARGSERLAKVLEDIQDYHASTEDLIALTQTSGVGLTALYHLVPGPRNKLMEKVFTRGFPDNMMLTRDGMWFELPVGSDAIDITDGAR